MTHNLSTRQTFAHAMVSGDTQRVAFLKTFPEKAKTNGEDSIISEASKFFRDPLVQEEIKKQRDLLREKNIFSIIDKLEWLQDTINDDQQKMSDRLKALEIANKMQGHYAAVKVENSGTMNLKHTVDPIISEALEKLFN